MREPSQRSKSKVAAQEPAKKVPPTPKKEVHIKPRESPRKKEVPVVVVP